MPRHLINKLEFELACKDEMLALNLRHNFTTTLQEQVTEVIDKVCSKYAGDGVYLRIDKLELDLGTMTPFGFREDVEKVLEYKLEEALRQKTGAMAVGGAAASGFFADTSPLALLQYFLVNGRLPWFATGEVNGVAGLVKQVLAEQAQDFSRWLQNAAPEQVWWRIAWQVPATMQGQIISLQPLSAELLAAAKETLNQLHGQLPENLKTSNNELPELLTPSLLKLVLMHVPASRTRPRQELVYKILYQLLANAEATLPDQTREQLIRGLPAISGISMLVSKDHSEELTTSGNLPAELPYEELLEQLPIDDPSATAAEKVLVSTAGLVLLAPFLTKFLTVLQCWDAEKKEWISHAARFKAIHLLHYLATGDTAAEEYALALEKVICGLPLAAPVPADVILEASEKQEADDLLHAVIGHWPMLKNTTIAGLRGSYLLREGLLAQQEDGWLLQVERKTLDVLLDGVPWVYNTLTFPWNKYLIMVEW
ncbi:contractile injection system tape measure protein [Chitinophaga sp. CB10]|uniref:contractile injection system tape measure protein n=1 Tax=Chitinophaga sp. CB10 TaxID=1891659 RepID=UPI0025C11B00|nr:contractile injection system tape measure protein [Chitinophaga sp. CB10]